jgi:hypothetical protein
MDMQNLDFTLERNRDCLIRFGLENFDHQLLFFRQVLKKISIEHILRWCDLLLEPVYWPAASLLDDEDGYYGQKVRLEPMYFELAEQGKIFWRDEKGDVVAKLDPWRLQAGVYLVDTRQKMPHRSIHQKEWTRSDSFLGEYLEIARRQRNYRLRVPLTAPFCVDDNLKRKVIQILAQQPDFQFVQSWRCERANEFNFIAQCFSFMPRRWDGETDMRVVFDDILMGTDEVEMGGGVEKSYLTGGCSYKGGLADVGSVDVKRAGDQNSSHYFRLIGILALES